MATLKEKRLAFLEDTIKHYNVNNRCTTIDGVCRYSPTTIDLVGKTDGCAIGRHVKPKVALKMDAVLYDSCNHGTSITNPEIFKLIPKKMQTLRGEFLYAVQELHDNEDNWNEQGISEEGKHTVNYIKKRFDLN